MFPRHDEDHVVGVGGPAGGIERALERDETTWGLGKGGEWKRVLDVRKARACNRGGRPRVSGMKEPTRGEDSPRRFAAGRRWIFSNNIF